MACWLAFCAAIVEGFLREGLHNPTVKRSREIQLQRLKLILTFPAWWWGHGVARPLDEKCHVIKSSLGSEYVPVDVAHPLPRCPVPLFFVSSGALDRHRFQ
jgi:hypothetical protein